MKKRAKNLVIIIFPYLFIDEKEGFEVDKLKLKPSYKENVDNEEEKVKNHLLNIVKLFRFNRNQQIFQWSYALTEVSNFTQWENLKDQLNKLTTVLRFSQLSDLNKLAGIEEYDNRFKYFNYFVFEMTKKQSVPYKSPVCYWGKLNDESDFEFFLCEGKAINPYIPHPELNRLTLTAEQIKKDKYFRILYFNKSRKLKNDEDKKILRAMEWFNRAHSHYGRGVDLSEAILNIHTAFETLLRPEEEERGVKAQIKTALLNILGHSKELELWFDDFWKLRNSIVHGDIKPRPLLYVHPKGKKGHRHHLYLANKIFIICLDTILKIRSSFSLNISWSTLEKEFIPNEVKINKAIKILKKKKNSNLEEIYKTKVFKFISELNKYDVSADKNKTKELGKLFLPFVKKDLEDNEKQDSKSNLIEAIDEILEWRGNDLSDLAPLYSNLQKKYHSVYFKDLTSVPEHISVLRDAAYNFFSFATWRF